MKRYFVQLGCFAAGLDDILDNMYADSFFTLISKTPDACKGIRLDNWEAPLFELKTETQQTNYVNYLKTDFARFCLAVVKITQNIKVPYLYLIPWLDFDEEWTDEKLFEKFEVSKELQEYIREFLPDYYGRRS